MGRDEAKTGRMPTDSEHAEMRRLLNDLKRKAIIEYAQ